MTALAVVERHRLGPRLYLLGRRVHEWQIGALLVVAAVALALAGAAEMLALAALLPAGAALVLKDRHDLQPSMRRLGVHRVPLPESPADLATRAQAAAHIHRLGGGTLDAFILRAAMAHDRLVDELMPGALVLIARDAMGRPRGFLQFLPVTGRPVVSLGAMRRDRDTSNGLTDFMVVEAARLLGERGVREFSLNFSAFGRWLRMPATRLESAAARLLCIGDRWFR